MADDRLKMLSKLALMNPDDKERQPYGEKARQELAEAHEDGVDDEDLDEDPPEDDTPEGAGDLADGEDDPDRLWGEIRRLRTRCWGLRKANIGLNAKVVGLASQIQDLEMQLAMLKAEDK